MIAPSSQTRWFVALVLLWAVPLSAQRLLDRVMARVGSDAVTLTDVQAAVGLGLVQTNPGAPDDRALQQVIDRRLALTEVERAPRVEPDDAAVAAEVERMTAHAGPRLNELLATTGITEERVPQIARDTLRIRTYLANRFPTVPVSDADAEDYFKAHPEAFRPGGVALTFEQAAPEARAAVAAERRARRIEQWLMNLRERVEVSIVP